MVLYARDERNIQDLDLFLSRLRIQIEPVTASQSDIAFEAFRRYGMGTGHKAGLNFGDCFAYALAIERNAPLLFKGDDFLHTDVRYFQV
jgi:ribonuclease VapC